MKIFVSGGAGVIGIQLVKKLETEGHEIFVGDLKKRPKEFSSKIRYREGDLNYITKFELEDFSPEIFFHLAATFERTVESPNFFQENYEHNIKLSHYLLRIISSIESMKRIVFASSYLIYDPSLYLNANSELVSLSENSRISPRNLTGTAKYLHERELINHLSGNSQEISFAIARIFRGYGIGSRDVISRWIRKLMINEEIEVFNENSHFDFIYCKDSAEGLKKLGIDSEENIIANLGSAKSLKISDVIKELKEFFPNMKVKKLQSEINIEHSQALNYEIESRFNFECKYSMKEAIQEIINHERNSLNVEPQQRNAIHVLITSSGNKITLLNSLSRNLKELNIHYLLFSGDNSTNNLAQHLWANNVYIPDTNEDNLSKILKIVSDLKIDYLLPTRDGELAFYAKYQSEFLKYNCKVILSSLDTVNICLDKLAFFSFLKERNYSVIPTFENVSDVGVEKIVVKERFGSGSRNIAINVNKEDALKASMFMDSPLFQPYIHGIEFSADLFVFSDGSVNCLLRDRKLVLNGESQITRPFKNNKLESQVITLAKELKIIGPAVIQGFIFENGEFIFNECNSRIGGASTLFYSEYMNLFEAVIKQSNQKWEFSRKILGEGVAKEMIRVKKDLFFDYRF